MGSPGSSWKELGGINKRDSSGWALSPFILYPKREPPPPDGLLRNLGDQVRTSLRECRDLGARGAELMQILGSIVVSEADGVPMVGLHYIMSTHLDKLLADMTNKQYHPPDMPIQLRADLAIAESLNRQWRKRFGDRYGEMDAMRHQQLTEKGGVLDGIEFDAQADLNSMDMWIAGTVKTPPEVVAGGNIREGRWWPTLACVKRDGIVLNASGTSIKGRPGVTALPLLKGTELAFFPSAAVKYVREGTMADMCVSLMSKVGSKMMIFRGHCLQSPFAPEAGVRYDGYYILRQYNQVRNPQTDIHRLTLRLERVEEQMPMHELCAIPIPSQIDEWQAFDVLEGDMIKQVLGEVAVMQWKLAKVKYSSEKKQFQNRLQKDYQAKSDKGKWEVKGKDAVGGDGTGPVSFKFSDLKWEH